MISCSLFTVHTQVASPCLCAHKHGLATCVWTVNREQDIIRMIEYGVDGIITDYPKKVQEICKAKNISWF